VHIGVRPTFDAAIWNSGFEEIFFSDPEAIRAVTETGHWWVSGLLMSPWLPTAFPSRFLALCRLTDRDWNCL
jgi:hypothetical protein